jgi:hypothetical protein
MATATRTAAATAPSILTAMPGVVPAPPGSGPTILCSPEWHSLRLFGNGRRPAGFEIGSERVGPRP